MIELEQNAFLLHSRPYRDNQVIAEFLTQCQGKVSAISYVGNSVKSSKKALLQPFIPLKVVLKGQGNLKSLSRIESTDKSFLLKGEYLYSGFYLNEIQVKLLGEHVPYEGLYRHYHQTLSLLAQEKKIEPILRSFEEVLLDELGLTIDYSIVFEQNSKYFNYLPEQGFIPTAGKNGSYLGQHLQLIAKQDVTSSDVMYTYKRLMRQIINQLLGGKSLNSRKLFKRK